MFLKFIVVLHYKQLTIGTPAYIYNFFDFLFNVNNLFILKNHVKRHLATSLRVEAQITPVALVKISAWRCGKMEVTFWILLRPLTVAFYRLFNSASAIANSEINRLAFFPFSLATPFCIVSDLLNVRAWCVCNLYFTWRRFRSYVYFEEHISVINYIYKVFSSGIEYDVLIFCCTNNTS